MSKPQEFVNYSFLKDLPEYLEPKEIAFPLIILIGGETSPVLVEDVVDLPSGKAFRVIGTRADKTHLEVAEYACRAILANQS